MKISLKNEDKVKTFLDMQKLEEFVRLVLQEIFKRFFRQKENNTKGKYESAAEYRK